ncbi:MAG: hypothetical protein CL908_09180 [Deltaproteobacteria bacterium]|nr:hypothetical protein [Deltaproteobacteria bacterium]
MLGLLGLMLVAAGIRAVAWSRTAVLFNDGPIFLALAEALADGRLSDVLAHPYHPLYPAAIALAAVGPIQLETAAIGVSIAGGLLSVGAIFWFVRSAFDRDAAWLAAWLVALHPWAVDFSADVMSDGLYSGFFLVGFAAMASAVARPTIGSVALCAVAGGLAYLVRPEGVGLPILAAMLLAARALVEPGMRVPVARGLVVLAAVSLLLVGPFVAGVARETGELVLTQKKSITNLAAGVGTPARLAPSVRRDGLRKPLPLPEFAIRVDGPGQRKPKRSPLGVLETVGRVGSTSLAAFRYELALFALLGLWSLRGRMSLWREGTVGLSIVAYSVVLMLLVWGAGYVSRRHALAAWLPAVAFAAVGWRWLCGALASWAAVRGWTRLARLDQPRVVCLMLLIVLAVVWVPRDLRERRADRAPVRAAARWLADHHSNSGAVAAQKLRTAYYAEADYVPLPSGLDGKLETHIRRQRARWVVIDEVKLVDHCGLEEGVGRWLRRVHVASVANRSAWVLEVVQ